MKNKLDAHRHYAAEDKAWVNEVLDDVTKKLERDQKEQRHRNIKVQPSTALSRHR